MYQLKNRIKLIRKELKLTQQEFSDRIGIKRGAIANYEIGRNEPVDSVISLICREFNVNEKWLRTGTGDMFIELDREDMLMQWVGKVLGSETNTFKKNFVKMLASLSEHEWELLERRAKELVGVENSSQKKD